MFAGSIQGKLPEYDLVFPTEQVKLVSLAHELSWSTWKCLSVCLACDLFFVYRPAMARCQYPEIFSCTFYCFITSWIRTVPFLPRQSRHKAMPAPLQRGVVGMLRLNLLREDDLPLEDLHVSWGPLGLCQYRSRR